MRSVTWAQALAWRMNRQYLETPTGATVPDVVARLAGVQAQVASAAELAVALRRADPGRGAVAHELWQQRSLIKSWAMRGTLHVLPIAEASAYLTLCATVRNWEKPSWQKAFGVSPEELEAMASAAGIALAGGAALSRADLTAAIVAETGHEHLAAALGSGWGSLLKPLAWWGILCHGPSDGTRVTFVAPSALPGWTAPPALEDAARTVIKAFLGAHGPATSEMFDNWLMRKGNRKKDLTSWFAAVADDVTTIDVDGERMLILTEHLDELLATPPSQTLRLVGGFDQYVLGAGTASTYLIPAHHRSDVSRTSGWISPVVLHRGRVGGVWQVEDGDIIVNAFEDLPGDELAADITRISALL